MSDPLLLTKPTQQPTLARTAEEREASSLAAALIDQSVLVERLPDLRQQFLTGGAWVLVGRLSGMIVSVLVHVCLAHALTPHEYGQFLLVASLIGMTSIVAMYGVNGTLMRTVSESVGLNDTGRGRQAFRIGTLVAGVSGPCAAVAIGGAVAWWYRGTPLAAIALPISVAVLFLAWQQIAAEGLRSLREHRLANSFSGGQSGGTLSMLLFVGLLFVGLLLCFLRGAQPSLATALWSYALAPAISLPLALLAVRRAIACRLPMTTAPASRTRTALCAGEFLRISGALFLIQALAFLTAQADIWFAGTFLPSEDLASYGVARRLTTLLVIPLQMVNLTLAPSIGEVSAVGDDDTLERALRGSSAIAFTITLVLFVLLATCGRALLGTLFGHTYEEAYPVLMILCLGMLVVAWCGSSGYALVMTGRQRAELSITLKSTVMLFMVTPFAALYFGGVGIAAAVSLIAAAKSLDEWRTVRQRLGVASHPDFSAAVATLTKLTLRLPRHAKG